VLEASWKLDEAAGRAARDSSTHGLEGRFSTEPTRVDGPLGRAVKFNGTTDELDFGRSTALRLAGTTAISAWINSSAFPFDDAAIVSSFDGVGLGYQLDTTVDTGRRTIGFKLSGACGTMMARYGATRLVVDRWYHVAGVYNAEARTLDVYLDGTLDNGALRGAVTGMQRSSRGAVRVGRRGNSRKYAFAGAISDVRIFSRSLTQAEIAAVRRGSGSDTFEPEPATMDHLNRRADGREAPAASCATRSDFEDAQLPGAAAVLGVLVAVVCAGLWPSSGALLSMCVSLGAGLFLLPAAASTLPTLGRCLIPLSSLAGGASIVAGRLRDLGDGTL
jgi:hypothetical protein